MKGILAIILSVFRIVVIPVQFQDKEFTYGPESINPLLGRATQYLDDQFRGTRTFEFTLAAPVTLKHSMDWYGANSLKIHDARINEAVIEACKACDNDIDFSAFDNDEDGKVDCIAILTAGPSESDGAGEDAIWPQQGRLADTQSTFQIDGKTADTFVAFTEIKSDYGKNPRLGGIGDLCHEILHLFGLPDFYDTDGETGGLSVGLWKSTSMMDSGNRNDSGNTPPNLNAIEMDILKLGRCDTLSRGHQTLSPIIDGGRYLKIPGKSADEFFLLECRKAEGWDKYIGGSGLLVYHVDRSEPEYSEFWKSNMVNADASRPGACIVAADPDADAVSKVFFPRPGKTAITSDINPAIRFHDGNLSPFAITDIRLTGEGLVEFMVSEPVAIQEINAFQDAAIVSWALDSETDPRSARLAWYLDGEKLCEIVAPAAGTYTIEHLSPQTEYEIRMSVRTKSGEPCSLSRIFKTKTFRKDIKPFIYLRSADRNPDGSFIRGARIPLRIFNVIDAEKTEWSFDGRPAAVGPDGFFIIEKDGRLKAKVYHSDGNVDIIIKDVIVR